MTTYNTHVEPTTPLASTSTLEDYFAAFRNNIIGNQQIFESPFGPEEIVYADWTASGRAYRPIEEYIQKYVLPFVANTHTETTVTGSLMSKAYEEAKHTVKRHVNAGSDDALVFCGSGMTAAVNKLQRILGLRIPERIMDYVTGTTGEATVANKADDGLQPVVFVTEMEHHSNHITWLETIAAVEIIQCDEDGNVDVAYFAKLLEKYKHRKNKIAAVTACSNVTGIQTPYHTIAKMIHAYNGLCFVDFACSAPYVNINMHPANEDEQLDAIYFSGHKFLGGPGTPGVLIFNKKLYTNMAPDQPGGGTVLYTNPWKLHEYVQDIEQREDGGTPPFLQSIKLGMCIKLKEAIGVENILQREEEILEVILSRFAEMQHVVVLEENNKERLGVVSFIVKGAHHNLVVKMLNDRFGIQTRGGCSCAGTYGHKLLGVDKATSYKILDAIHGGNMLCKPGWVRLSIHPTMPNAEIDFIMDAIELTASHFKEWKCDYTYNAERNEYVFKGAEENIAGRIGDWFNADHW